MAKHVRNVVLFDPNPRENEKTEAEAHGIIVHSYDEVMRIGMSAPGEDPSMPKPAEKHDIF
jgi:hypothetical protein